MSVDEWKSHLFSVMNRDEVKLAQWKMKLNENWKAIEIKLFPSFSEVFFLFFSFFAFPSYFIPFGSNSKESCAFKALMKPSSLTHLLVWVSSYFFFTFVFRSCVIWLQQWQPHCIDLIKQVSFNACCYQWLQFF